MSEFKINLDEKAITDLTSAGILAQLGAEQRDRLLKESLVFLLSKRTVGEGWNKKEYPSPLQDAFDSALRNTAVGIARTLFETDEGIKEKVKSVIEDAVNKALTEKRDELVDGIAEAVLKGFKIKEEY